MRRFSFIALVLTLALAASASASARPAWIKSRWGKDAHIGVTHYRQRPKKVAFLMTTRFSGGGYWLIKQLRWHNWRHPTATAKGELASAALQGTPVTVVAHGREPFPAGCSNAGDNIYTKVTLHIKGGFDRKVPRSTLVPRCGH